jgi:hypothetical protein
MGIMTTLHTPMWDAIALISALGNVLMIWQYVWVELQGVRTVCMLLYISHNKTFVTVEHTNVESIVLITKQNYDIFVHYAIHIYMYTHAV